MLRNLLSNALKFTPHGGRVTVRAYVKMGRTDADAGAGGWAGAQGGGRRASLRASLRMGGKEERVGGGRGEVKGQSVGQGGGRKKSTQINTSKRIAQSNGRVAADGSSGSGTASATAGSGGGEGEREGRFVVEVTDSGAGISKANQAKLFREVRVLGCGVVWWGVM